MFSKQIVDQSLEMSVDIIRRYWKIYTVKLKFCLIEQFLIEGFKIVQKLNHSQLKS